MKKTIIFIVLMLMLYGGDLYAQTPKSIAVKPGLAFAKQNWKDKSSISTNEYLEGLYVGVNLEFFYHKWLSMLAETGFTMKRNTTTKQTKSLDYLYLAPMIKVRKEFGNFIPYLFFGPRMDVLLTGSYEEAYPYNLKPNTAVFGLIAGLGLEYKLSPCSILLGLHDQYDISCAIGIPEDGVSMKYNVIVLSFGVKFYFKGKGE